jgi:hypothetical protein
MDEFSPLVEAALIPALALADQCGGMYEVFRRWVSWIEASNDARGAASYRRGYGSPADFATFVLGELRESDEAAESVLAAALAVQLNLLVVQKALPQASMTMASHRSLVLPSVDAEGAVVTLASKISRGQVITSLALDFDVTPALDCQLGTNLVREPTYLVWQATGDDTVRLLRVDRFIYETLAALGERSIDVGQLILERFAGDDVAGGSVGLDAVQMLDSLTGAAREGLVRV